METFSHGVERGEFDTVISGQSYDVDLIRSYFAQMHRKSGSLAVSVVVEAAVTVDIWVSSFLENVIDCICIQTGGKLGSRCSLNAVDGPEDLLQTMKIDRFSDFMFIMVVSKATVISGVKILCGNHMVVVGDQLVYD